MKLQKTVHEQDPIELVELAEPEHKDTSDLTPLMQQYHTIKVDYPDTLLFFQVGDFYELFFDDAKQAAAFLGIALTSRGKNKGEPIPLCGVPIHAKDYYVARLVKGGFNIALCDQLEPPRPGTIVARGVVQVLTPGTLTDSKLLDAKSASYLFSFFPMENQLGLLFGELLTGQLFATVLPVDSVKMLESEIVRFFPDEIIVPDSTAGKSFQSLFKRSGYTTSVVDYNLYAHSSAQAAGWVKSQFKASDVELLEKNESLKLALYYFYAYVQRNQRVALDQFSTFHMYQPEDFLMLDGATQRNLELVKNSHGNAKNTLFAMIDGAVTPMGSRMIKKWLLRPLIKQKAIVQRQDVVELFMNMVTVCQQLTDLLVQVGDVERVIGRIALTRATVHDYIALKRALGAVAPIRQLVNNHTQHALMQVIYKHMADFTALHELLDQAIHDEVGHDYIVKVGFDPELDRLRELVVSGNEKILLLEREQQVQTGISSLKIRYTQQQGYYIEITKANLHLVPQDYIRQQSLVGKERFVTTALRELQHDIMRARTDIEHVEAAVFARIKADVAHYLVSLRKLAYALAHVDALLGFAQVANAHDYVRPLFNDKRDIVIVGGRHPVIEQTTDAVFIGNDTRLTDEQSLWIITGPNMGGKSTYLRQVALINILAQCGAFVPAKQASLPIVDRVFTRIGAGDNLAENKSTFLIEMEETATICKQATRNSLVILDEVGRGTSTFDGLAIAQAVVEHIYTTIGARCLFATHYHELTQLHAQHAGIVPYHAASKKTDNGIIFLYKMVRGVADGSFGIEVAKLAQLPESLITRSQQLLVGLTQSSEHTSARFYGAIGKEHANGSDNGIGAGGYVGALSTSLEASQSASVQEYERQIAHLQAELARNMAVLSHLDGLDYDNLSPKQAFDLLWRLRQKE